MPIEDRRREFRSLPKRDRYRHADARYINTADFRAFHVQGSLRTHAPISFTPPISRLVPADRYSTPASSFEDRLSRIATFSEFSVHSSDKFRRVRRRRKATNRCIRFGHSLRSAVKREQLFFGGFLSVLAKEYLSSLEKHVAEMAGNCCLIVSVFQQNSSNGENLFILEDTKIIIHIEDTLNTNTNHKRNEDTEVRSIK